MNNVGVVEGMVGMFAVGIAYVAVLLPALIILIVFLYRYKDKKNKYEAVVAVSKNIEDPSEIKVLLNDLKEKKQPITADMIFPPITQTLKSRKNLGTFSVTTSLVSFIIIVP